MSGLLATALMSVAKSTKGRTEILWIEVSVLMGVAEDAMMARGKARLDEKTVIDAVEGARVATEGLNDPMVLVSSLRRPAALARQRINTSSAAFTPVPSSNL